MDQSRASVILLHPTSLPGPFGIGDLGPEAYKFVDFLVSTGQSLWQILPLIFVKGKRPAVMECHGEEVEYLLL